MNKIYFSEPLPDLILKRIKNTTWRINEPVPKRISNTENIKNGDVVSLCRRDETEFAKAKVTRVKETTFGELTAEDKQGHEDFSSDEEMYQVYSDYYNIEVSETTKLKIIKFELIVDSKL